jgi:hypothetical protein
LDVDVIFSKERKEKPWYWQARRPNPIEPVASQPYETCEEAVNDAEGRGHVVKEIKE